MEGGRYGEATTSPTRGFYLAAHNVHDDAVYLARVDHSCVSYRSLALIDVAVPAHRE